MGNAYNPRTKFAGGGIFALLQFGYDLDKCFLEQVVCHITVVDNK